MPKKVFVTIATGKQGRALSSELLRRGYSVTSLTRDLQSASAVQLSELGVELHEGQLSCLEDVQGALAGVDAVWMALPPGPQELACGHSIIQAAREKGIEHLVYSSVARTGEHSSFPGWSDSYPLAWYWKQKATMERAVREAGFTYWTILRPAFFMQNFCQPDVEHMFPGLATDHVLRVAYRADTRLDVIDTSDIAHAAADAFDSPLLFQGKELGLASEKLTPLEIADVLSQVSGSTVSVAYLDDDQIKEAKNQGHVAIDAQVWARDVGYNVDTTALKPYDLRLRSLYEALTKQQLGW